MFIGPHSYRVLENPLGWLLQLFSGNKPTAFCDRRKNSFLSQK